MKLEVNSCDLLPGDVVISVNKKDYATWTRVTVERPGYWLSANTMKGTSSGKLYGKVSDMFPDIEATLANPDVESLDIYRK